MSVLFRSGVSVVVALALALGLLPAFSLAKAYADEDPDTVVQSDSAEDDYDQDEGWQVPDDIDAEQDPAPDGAVDRMAIWDAGVGDEEEAYEVYPRSMGISAYSTRAATPTVKPMTFSSEMLYFCKYESSCNYDQGLSAGDNYHAMGYFQFDNRYDLGNFLKAAYNYNTTTYKALKVIGTKYNWDVSGATRSNGKFTTLGNDLNAAWHAAYKANPTEFSRLQNGWAYSQYYDGTVGVRGSLKAMGIDIDKRADCVKGLVWGMSNLFGAGGGAGYVKQGLYYGCNWFFKEAGIRDSMTDVEMVTALCNCVVDKVAEKYKDQPQYHKGWQNRYKSELSDCLKYLSGEMKNTWCKVGGYWYWYDAKGDRATGWKTISGKKYYFDSVGRMQTGWEKISSKWYYFNSSGVMTTGWQKISGKWYYLNSSGVMQTGWVTVSGKRYHLTSSGAMTGAGWHKISNVWYYMTSSGAVKTGWFKSGGKWYYLNGNGAMQTGWVTVSGKRYHLTSSGAMTGAGWHKISGKWYYMASSGAAKTGWMKSGKTSYYFNSSCAMVTGWQKISNKWYYFKSSGAMATGWLKLSGKWYYLSSDGVMKTGWATISGKKYYFSASGVMLTGSQKIAGKTYRFASSGALM